MKNFLRASVFWSIFFSITLAFFVWLLLVYLYHRLLKPERLTHGCHKVAILWGTTTMRLTPGWRYEVRGKDNIPKDRPVMIVANHQSAADIWAIFLLDTQFRWLSKASMFKLPIIGQAMTWAGYVPVERGNRMSQIRALEKSREWIRRGVSMVYFPEGTRSVDGKPKEFKSGAFRIAMDEKVDVIPVVLKGTREMVVKNSGMPKPANLLIDIMPAEKWREGEDAEDFASRVQQLITARLEALNAEDSRSAVYRSKKAERPSMSIESLS